MTALAKVGQIMIPAVIIIYAYALVGLYSFSGIYPLKKIMNTVNVEPLITN